MKAKVNVGMVSGNNLKINMAKTQMSNNISVDGPQIKVQKMATSQFKTNIFKQSFRK